MIGKDQLELLWKNLRDLGTRRLIALGLIALVVVGAIALGAYYLGQPEREPLYSNLTREDVNRIGGALKDAGIPFDVAADGTSVLVAHSDTAKARMLLAVKGLPQSANTGYELFNDVRAFGLTSFMQEVTRVRALEGELARTIQTMKGVKAARVHIVLPDRASFRRDQQQASASVVIRTENAEDASTAQAIRHLVAAAVPGLKLDDVTVLNTEGAVLSASDDGANAATGKKAALQQQVNRETEEKIRRTLTPYLGMGNFEVSVTSRLDTDKVTTQETTFDPASKVERSVRVVKELGQTQNRTKQPSTSVQQNIPAQQSSSDNGTDSSENNSRREELTNFEVSTRTVQTVRDAYLVRGLSIAVLVNKERLAAPSGPGGEVIPVEQQIYEVEQLVGSAAGFDKERGDKLKVVAVPFADGGHALEPVPPLPWTELLLRQAGTMINALTILVVAGLLIWFGLKPAVRAILARPEPEAIEADVARLEAAMLAAPQIPAVGGPGEPAGAPAAAPAAEGDEDTLNLIEDLTSRKNRSPQKRLEQIVEFDEEQAAAILRQWLHQEARA
ncbi:MULTISPECIES: flagellar basal-body MS-ring/collar protein FliF [unclassified Xanthobacter]|uniref:flagellar basal-body MS-ring/collar protein FliF n=1 Tax=unclassified Xanthobacter TaxID=2623496 RepID=UPI001EE0BFE4|nr:MULTISPECIES: flagellar basal-body MS-ring/collar protein FliF [unclassified Xanthobacter]